LGSWEQGIASVLHAFHLDRLKHRILAFALLATLIPSLTTAWLSYTHNRRALAEKITTELRNISSHAAREADLWLKTRFLNVRVFATSDVVTENLARILDARARQAPAAQAVRRLEDYLTSVRERVTSFDRLSVVAADGRVVASTGDLETLHLPDDWLRRIAEGEEIRGLAYRDDASQPVLVRIAERVTAGDDRFLGAVAATLNLRAIDELLRQVAPGETGHVYLVRGDGTVLVSSRMVPAALLSARLPEETMEALLTQQGGSLEYVDPQGNEVIGTLDRVPQLEWAVVAEISTAEAFVQIAELRRQTVSLVLVLLLTVGLIAYVLGLTISRPLDRLTTGAAQVAGGNLEVDLPVVTRGELGYLTRVFNDMVARLRDGRAELERLSVTDGLTGLYNRNHLMETLSKEIARSDRQEEPMAAMMIDIDHFKNYNDTFGHLEGDRVLAEMGSLFQDCTREVDYTARYGGEEFMILLPQTDLDGAVEVAERIRRRVLEAEPDAREKHPGISLSIGVAEYPRHGDTVEAIIAAADAALYRAKRGGRNRVVPATAKTKRAPSRARGKKARKRA
jgi:diguanylate cyclase (GGDEF)-like protein